MSMFGGDDELVIHARVDNDASPELRDVRDELRGVATQAQTTGRTASRTSRDWNIMGKAAKAAAFGAKLAFGAALAGGYALVRLLKSSFGEAREAQKVGATTAAIIKATGGAAKVTERQVSRLAGRLSAVAGIDDELIQKGANLLLTFKQIRNEQGKGNKIFDRATRAAVNLSAAGFGSVESGSKMLGKALNDPLKGITALSRAGVTFTQVQQDTITKLVEQGDLLKAQKIILGEVESQVGGVAAAQATWGDKAKVTFENIEERLGTALLPLLDDVQRWFVQTGGPALDRYVGIFERKGVPAIRNFVDEVKPLAREYLPEMWDVLKSVYGTIKDLAPLVGDLLKGFNDLPAWAKTSILVAAGSLKVARSVNSKSGVLGTIATMARPLPVIVTNPGFAMGGGKGGTGVVAGGGGKTGTTGAKGGKGRGLLMGAGLPGAILTGLSFNSDVQGILADPFAEIKAEAMWPWTDGPFSDKATDDAVENTSRSARALRQLLTKPLGIKGGGGGGGSGLEDLLLGPIKHTQELGSELDKVGKRKVRPDLFIDGMPKAQDSTRQLIQQLTGLDRQRPTPRVNLDTSLAELRLQAFQSKLNAMAASGVGVPFTSGAGGVRREHGGRVLPGRSYIVGERRPERFVPDEPGRIMPRVSGGNAGAWGGVTIENLTVHAEGASSEVDVQDAVTQALDDYFREREERA